MVMVVFCLPNMVMQLVSDILDVDCELPGSGALSAKPQLALNEYLNECYSRLS